MTPLDDAHAAMEAQPDDATLRLAFYDRLAGSELFLALEAEAQGDNIRPRVFDVEGGRFVLAFDREDRLSAFAEGSAPYAALSGRALAGMLAGQGLGIALNPGVAPSATLIDAVSVDWLQGILSQGADAVEARVEEVGAPVGVPQRLLRALDARLASASGRARLAYLVGTVYAGGQRGNMLVFIDPADGAEPALTRLVADGLRFSGVDAGSLDVAFFRSADAMAARLARVGLRFDLPEPEAPRVAQRPAPGSDPAHPPKLR